MKAVLDMRVTEKKLAGPSMSQGPYARMLRWLHLALALVVTALAITGLIFHYRKPLGIDNLKLSIMFVHAMIGYALLLVISLRVYFGVRGAEAMRFRHVLPRGKDFSKLFSLKPTRERWKFAGRSPLSRVVAGLLLILITTNLVTGLVRAGTDLYLPPFGPFIQAHIAKDGVAPSMVKPGEGTYIDESRYAPIKRAKTPFGTAHYYVGLSIMAIALFHIIGVLSKEWSAPNDKRSRGRARLMLFGPEKGR